MNLWTWNRLAEAFQEHPQQFEAYQKLPTDYATFDEWQEIDEQKTDIITAVIGCKCAETLKEQQREAMAYRRTICSTAREWLEKFTGDPSHAEPVSRIARRYLRKKKCHRNYEGPRAGVRCYCDVRNH